MSEEKQEPKLHVDEDWKKSVSEEKAHLREKQEAGRAEGPSQPGAAGQRTLPEPSIPVFMAGLHMQTLIALGQVPNPVTQKREADAAEAEYLIDTIAILVEKMAGNLSAEESAYVNGVLSDLRMRYVNVTSGRPEPAQEAPPPDDAEADAG